VDTARHVGIGGAERVLRVKVAFLAILGALVAAGAAAPAATASLAVVGTDADVGPLCSLVEVELVGRGVELVERARIDSVLQEQKLSAAGLTDRDALIKVGQLLKANAFLLLSVEEGPAEEDKEALVRLRLAETVHGIRLVDQVFGWERERIGQCASQIADRAAEAAAKLELPAGQLVPVGIVDVHRILLGEEKQWLCRAAQVVLSARLAREPRVVVLEREDLRLLTEELILTGGDRDSLWAPGALVEGTIRRTDVAGAELTLQVRPAGGEAVELGPFAFAEDAVNQAAQEAAEAAVQQVTQAPPAATWEPEKEAAEFFRQGRLLAKHARYVPAFTALDTASALAPDNVEYALELLTPAQHLVWRIEDLGLSDVEVAEIASRLMSSLDRPTWENANPFSLAFGRLERYLGESGSFSGERAGEINRATRRRWADRYRAFAEKYTPHWSGAPPFEPCLIGSDSAAEAMQCIKETVQLWLFPPERGGRVESVERRVAIASYIFERPPSGCPGHLRDERDALAEGFSAYVRELVRDGDPLVRFAACLAPLSRDGGRWLCRSLSQDAELRAAWAEEAVKTYALELRFVEDLPDQTRKFPHTALVRAVGESPWPTPKKFEAYEELYSPAIEANDAQALMTWPDVGSVQMAGKIVALFEEDPQAAFRCLHFVEQSVPVLEGGKEDEQVADRLEKLTGRIAATRRAFEDKVRQLDIEASELTRKGRTDKAAAVTGRVNAMRAALEQRATPVEPLKLSVTMLASNKDWPRYWRWAAGRSPGLKMQVQPGKVWLAISDAEADGTARVGLVRIDGEGPRVGGLWQTEVPAPRRHEPFIGGLAVTETASYVAIGLWGLVDFPGGGGAPAFLTSKEGLPESPITSVAWWNDRLWLSHGGYGTESGLGAYDPAGGEYRSAFSSAEKGGHALTHGETYRVRELLAEPAGLYIAVDRGDSTDSWGLWRLDGDGGMPERILSAVNAGPHQWVLSESMLARLPADMETMRRLAAYTKGEMEPVPPGRLLEEAPLWVGGALPRSNLGFWTVAHVDGNSAAVYKDRFWGRKGDHHILVIKRGQRYEDAHVIENDILDGRPVMRFFASPFGLIAVGEGDVGIVSIDQREAQ